ncbi:MAG: adenylate kinase family protein [Methanocellales archaeon]
MKHCLNLKQRRKMRTGITGTPGTGKTEVCNVLKSKYHYKIIDLNAVIKEKKFYTGRDLKRDTLIVDIPRLKKYFAELKGEYIVEGHLAHHLDLDLVIILRTKPKMLRKRLEAKNWNKEKIRENVEAEALDVILIETLQRHKLENIHEIDTTNKTPNEVANCIVEIIEGKKTYPPGKIDYSQELFNHAKY